VGISVSRVGGSAQVKTMKKVAGTLKLDQAQYRELEAFAKFGSDLDAATTAVLEKGKRNVEILKQGLNEPMSVEHQVAIIYCGVEGLLNNVSVTKIKDCEKDLIRLMEKDHQTTLQNIKKGVWSEEIQESIKEALSKVLKNY